MRTHIDWLTFTMTPIYRSSYAEGTTPAESYVEALETAFLEVFGASLLNTAFGGNWEKQEKSRAPYTDAWNLGESGIVLFGSLTLNHCCVEISGAGCERLIKLKAMNEVLTAVHERVTRIDIACDVETKTTPENFVSVLSHGRMRANGFQTSSTGTTCYIGSKTSDRYARVYRYNKPHPRAHLLRIEHVFRRKHSKVVAKALLEHGLEGVAFASGTAFGWQHKDWEIKEDENISISTVSGARDAGKTIFWLINSCAPAFKRLCASGGILSAEEFLRTYFLDD